MTDDELAEAAPRIQAMIQTPGWQDFLKLVQEKIEIVKNQAIDGTPADLPFHQGSIKGMLAAVASANDALDTVRFVSGEKQEARRRRFMSASGPRANFD